jgi:hypothetical protein
VLYSVLIGIGTTSTVSLNPSVFLGREMEVEAVLLSLPGLLAAAAGRDEHGPSLIFRRLGEYRSSSARSYLRASVKHATPWVLGCCQYDAGEMDKDKLAAGADKLNPWSC